MYSNLHSTCPSAVQVKTVSWSARTSLIPLSSHGEIFTPENNSFTATSRFKFISLTNIILKNLFHFWCIYIYILNKTITIFTKRHQGRAVYRFFLSSCLLKHLTFMLAQQLNRLSCCSQAYLWQQKIPRQVLSIQSTSVVSRPHTIHRSTFLLLGQED